MAKKFSSFSSFKLHFCSLYPDPISGDHHGRALPRPSLRPRRPVRAATARDHRKLALIFDLRTLPEFLLPSTEQLSLWS